MGIIEAIKMIEREEAFEKGIQKGIEKGKEEVKAEFVTNLLLANRFSISEIADFANVDEAFVKKINKQLKK